jgi:hypothetical protein
MADFPSDRRLALFGAWRQIRPSDRRETSATDPSYEVEPFFQLSRFSTFAPSARM